MIPNTPPSKITPCLWFNDTQAEEAARFYVSLLPNSKIDVIERSPVDTPSGPVGSVLLVEFTFGGMCYLALNGAPNIKPSDAVSFQIICENQMEIDHLWAALSKGGETLACGWLRDRWGIAWQIIPRRLMELIKDPKTSARAMTAMMDMIKIDVAALESAVVQS